MEEFGIVIGVCVILPVSIVLIVFLAGMYSDKKRSQVLIKAIEANNGIDADKLAEAMTKPKKTPLERLNSQLLRGCIFTLAAVPFAILAAASYPGLPSGGISQDVEMYMTLGGISFAVGIAYLITYFVTRKDVLKA